MFGFKRNNVDLEEVLKQLNMYTMQVALELETLKKLSKRFDELNERLTQLESRIKVEEPKTESTPLSLKNKSAIKLIIQRYGEITSYDLSKIVKLSRTRCNEYLVDMEKEGILVSKIKGKKKYYALRK